MLDSGSTLSAVAPSVLAALQVVPGPSTLTRTAAGPVTVNFYQISFTIYHLASGGATLSRPDWTVTNLSEDLDDVEMLFGLDLLREIVLTVDGPGQTFSLDF
jgi:hypothetical protein